MTPPSIIENGVKAGLNKYFKYEPLLNNMKNKGTKQPQHCFTWNSICVEIKYFDEFETLLFVVPLYNRSFVHILSS